MVSESFPFIPQQYDIIESYAGEISHWTLSLSWSERMEIYIDRLYRPYVFFSPTLFYDDYHVSTSRGRKPHMYDVCICCLPIGMIRFSWLRSITMSSLSFFSHVSIKR